MTDYNEMYKMMMEFKAEKERRGYLLTLEKDQLVEFAKHLHVYRQKDSKKDLICEIVSATNFLGDTSSDTEGGEDTTKPLKLREESYITHITLREGAKTFYQLIEDTAPNSPERFEALKKVEEALMWANTALSRYVASKTGSDMMKKELFLGHREKIKLDWPDFTLNPLAKTQPEQVCFGCDKSPCECLYIGRRPKK